MNIDILRGIDHSIGGFLVRLLSMFKSEAELTDKPKKILIIKLFGFGNFIFLSPTIDSIKKRYPQAKIEVLTYSQNKDICMMYEDIIDEVHTLRYSVFGMVYDIMSFVAKSYKEYDIIIDAEQFVRLSAIIGALARPKYLIGISTKESGKKKIFDKWIEYKEDKHVVEEYFGIASVLGCKDFPKKVIRPKILSKNTRNVLKKLDTNNNEIIIGICPGSRNDDIERRYPKKLFVLLLEKILEHKNIKILFFGSAHEKAYITDIINLVGDGPKIKDLSGMNLRDSSAIISKCDIFISNDTGPLHLASALDVFCIGLYGPSKQWIYGPYTKKKIILRSKNHPPIRSNHNEKNIGWNEEWWPSPDYVYKNIIKVLNNK